MKMNKKGFTLIELLAVIIILGVLMIIAIPSVTTYIQNSRKSAWVDTSVAYVKSTVNKVNEGGKLQFFTEHVLYLVPVGHVAANSCVSVESGGQSPFSDSWRYAYVGVIYNGKGYDYYFIGEDAAGQGIDFVSQKDLNDNGTDDMYSVTKVAADKGQKILADAYSGDDKIKGNYVYSVANTTKFKVGTEDVETTKSEYTKLSGILTTSNLIAASDENVPSGLDNKNYFNKIVIVAASDNNKCEYTPE